MVLPSASYSSSPLTLAHFLLFSRARNAAKKTAYVSVLSPWNPCRLSYSDGGNRLDVFAHDRLRAKTNKRLQAQVNQHQIIDLAETRDKVGPRPRKELESRPPPRAA